MTISAFDADVLIYAASREHPLGAASRQLISGSAHRVGSVLLLPELLSKPMRTRDGNELAAIEAVLSDIELVPVDASIAALATVLGVRHGLKALDATHLATAVTYGVDRFATNNTRDFDAHAITEVEVVHPSV